MPRAQLPTRLRPLAWGSVVLGATCAHPNAASEPAQVEARYEFRASHDPDGTGKFYLGREIAAVMGHAGADWLERPERQQQERPDLLVPALKLKPGDAVADIGAGTGYYTWRLAEQVGEKGLVYAVDVQPEMLERLERNLSARHLTNYWKVLGTASDPKLPAQALDLVLLVDVYHEFSEPFEMVQALCRALKPGGRLVFIEFRAEDPDVPIKAVHKMTEPQVRREMVAQPVTWDETIETLPWQHIVVFRKGPPLIPGLPESPGRPSGSGVSPGDSGKTGILAGPCIPRSR